ncbi:GNAT family N-acetyltransferase, partial [Priestia megaterium]
MIREATKEDLMDILDIYNDAILNTTVVYTYKPETLEDRAVWYNQKLDQGYPIL